jgi:hypothetical protein
MAPATIDLRGETRCIISGDSRGPGAESDALAVKFNAPKRWRTQMNLLSFTVLVMLPFVGRIGNPSHGAFASAFRPIRCYKIPPKSGTKWHT